jgi:hypothetical protein
MSSQRYTDEFKTEAVKQITSTSPRRRNFLRFLTDRRTLPISAPFLSWVDFVSQPHQTTGVLAVSISK